MYLEENYIYKENLTRFEFSSNYIIFLSLIYNLFDKYNFNHETFETYGIISYSVL